MNRKQILLSCLALCFCAAPANADLFEFAATNLNNVFTSGTSTFTASKTTGSVGSLTGLAPPAAGSIAEFHWNSGDAGDFVLTMTISDILADTATGAGVFTFTDASGTADTVTGDIFGKWSRYGSFNVFGGALGDVKFNNNSGGGTFDGGASGGGSVDMGFLAPLPWYGAIVEIISSNPGFFTADFDVTGGSVGAIVPPLPSAILLGILGLGTAGFGLRRRLA